MNLSNSKKIEYLNQKTKLQKLILKSKKALNQKNQHKLHHLLAKKKNLLLKKNKKIKINLMIKPVQNKEKLKQIKQLMIL